MKLWHQIAWGEGRLGTVPPAGCMGQRLLDGGFGGKARQKLEY